MCDSKCIVIFLILINGDAIFAVRIFALLTVFTDYITAGAWSSVVVKALRY
jgi:hypothetical protein